MPSRKPAKLKVLEGRGNGRDSGGRIVPDAPSFKRIPPERPADLSDDAAEWWDQLVPELARLDLLKELDQTSLRACCETYSRWREAVRQRQQLGLLTETSQGVGVAPWVRVEEAANKELRAWCSEFGLTPATEAKLATKAGNDDGGESNPFAAGTG